EYDQSTRGLLMLYRDRKYFDEACVAIPTLTRLGVPAQALDRAGCVAREPALERTRAALVGGIYYPADEAGDCRAFTHALAARAAARGVRFLTQTKIERLVADGDRIESIATNRGPLDADHYVAACGSYTPLLLR